MDKKKHEDLEMRLASTKGAQECLKESKHAKRTAMYVVLCVLFSCAGMPECQFQLAK